MAAYMYHKFSDAGLKFFSSDMAYVKTLGWDEENNRPIMEDSAGLDAALSEPALDSQMAAMFDLSGMEKKSSDANRKEDECLSCPGKGKSDGDNALNATALFSKATNFSKFFHPDGREKTATDRRQEWHSAGNTGEPPTWIAEELEEKEAAQKIFEEAVRQSTAAQVQEQVEQQLKLQAMEHQAERDAAALQMSSLQTQLDQLLQLLPQGQTVTAGGTLQTATQGQASNSSSQWKC